MEGQASLLVLMLLLSFISCGQTGQRSKRSGSLGCSFNGGICDDDEYCYKDTHQPNGKCKKIKYRNQMEKADLSEITYETFKHYHDANPEFKDKEWPNKNRRYDMTYFENRDSVDEPLFEEHATVRNKETTRRNNVRARDSQFDVSKNERYIDTNAFENVEHRKTLKRDEDGSDDWQIPMEIPVILPDQMNKKRMKHTRRTTESDMIHNENSLDLDVEIEPLSISDAKHFDEEKVKLSSIPKKPTAEKETLQEIEHIQTNIVDTKPSKKAKVGMLIGGKLNEAKANIVHEKSRDKTYAKVKDFFKSQQVSSIVDVPLAEKKEGIKFYSLSSEVKDDNVKRDTIPHPPVYPRGIRLHMKESLNPDTADDLVDTLQDLLWGQDPAVDKSAFTSVQVEEKSVLFHMINNTTTSGQEPSSIVERINRDQSLKSALNKATGVNVVSASLQFEHRQPGQEDGNFMVTTLIVAGCITGILLASVCIFIVLKRTQANQKWIMKPVGQEAASDYQSLWRQLRQATWDAPIHAPYVAHSDSSDLKTSFGNKGQPPNYSWSEEPVDTKMDISTGHVVLSYMEDHLKNENRLSKEWEDLNVYEAEPNDTYVGKDPKNSKKNRYSDVLPYDHNRVKLRETSNATGSDYINASYIIDDDPRNPAYIATQGPLGSTVADFWQMIWEQGVVVIVMLTKLADLGLPQCHRYWPEKGNETYHIYQVHLISEHIWCSEFLVRSFYLKNVQTEETRTVTQFHFLTWPHLGVPDSSKPLLDFRRKVLKCFRNQSSPVVVHCSGGIDRTGTYILIDMVLGKISKGTREIDIAATLEHLRDQRADMVKTRVQFEFALISVAEELNAVLQVLTKHR